MYYTVPSVVSLNTVIDFISNLITTINTRYKQLYTTTKIHTDTNVLLSMLYASNVM